MGVDAVRELNHENPGGPQESPQETPRCLPGDFKYQTTGPADAVLVGHHQRDHEASFYLRYLPGAPFQPSTGK